MQDWQLLHKTIRTSADLHRLASTNTPGYFDVLVVVGRGRGDSIRVQGDDAFTIDTLATTIRPHLRPSEKRDGTARLGLLISLVSGMDVRRVLLSLQRYQREHESEDAAMFRMPEVIGGTLWGTCETAKYTCV